MKMRKRFPWGASQAALISATSLLSGMAIAQEAPKPANDQEASQLDEIVITGTSIKGVTPIGSNLVSVGVDELEKSAATNLSTLVNTIPALSTNGSLAQGENLWSIGTVGLTPTPVVISARFGNVPEELGLYAPDAFFACPARQETWYFKS